MRAIKVTLNEEQIATIGAALVVSAVSFDKQGGTEQAKRVRDANYALMDASTWEVVA